MKLQKIILCVAVALTAFGVSLGLFEIGRYLSAVFQPIKPFGNTMKPIPLPTIVYPPPPVVENKQPPVFKTDQDSESKAYCDLNGEGNYIIAGANPKGFEDFDSLIIITRDYESRPEIVNGIPIKPKGSLQMNQEFTFSWINITGKLILFVTQTKKGRSYQFDGKFVKEEVKLKDADGTDYTEAVILKGRLTKWRGGKKIAEAKVKFAGDCGCG